MNFAIGAVRARWRCLIFRGCTRSSVRKALSCWQLASMRPEPLKVKPHIKSKALLCFADTSTEVVSQYNPEDLALFEIVDRSGNVFWRHADQSGG